MTTSLSWLSWLDFFFRSLWTSSLSKSKSSRSRDRFFAGVCCSFSLSVPSPVQEQWPSSVISPCSHVIKWSSQSLDFNRQCKKGRGWGSTTVTPLVALNTSDRHSWFLLFFQTVYIVSFLTCTRCRLRHAFTNFVLKTSWLRFLHRIRVFFRYPATCLDLSQCLSLE